jgi:MFS family permease
MSDVIVADEPTNIEKMRGLRWGVAEAAANTIFVQLVFFGSVFILFLNELGLNKSQIGLLLSFFPFFGVIAVFIVPWVSRFGYKRTFIVFWTIRKFITMFLLLVPWVLAQFGSQVTLFFVGFIVLVFGLCRAIAMVGYYPWDQEFVPASMRGKYSAATNVVGSVVGIISILIASFVIENYTGLNRFMVLFAIGIAFGLLGVWFLAQVPGGAPEKGSGTKTPTHHDMLITLHDRNFWLFLLSLGIVTLATTPMFAFLPLYMKQEVGLSEGEIVLLQTGMLIGALSASFLVGWSADRYGSKPIMLSGLSLMVLLPIVWLLIPQYSPLSLPIAFAAAILQGIATLTWSIGSGRLLYVSIVPPIHKAAYMAVYYAIIGAVGGVSQLLGGIVLDYTANFSGEFMFYVYDPFTPIFILALLLLVVGTIVTQYVRSDTQVGSREFAGMFIRGNLFIAFGTMFRYYRAKDERTTVVLTKRLGHTHSPFTINELVDALVDPRFNVRFEAIVSIAHTHPNPQFVEALGKILHGTELALSGTAAWALGRIGDKRARETLRKGLHSEYKSICAQSARALGTLGDETIVPILLERLKTETDKGVRMAYASALGSLAAKDAVQPLLELLDWFYNVGARTELALSLGRILGQETYFIRLLRQIRREPGTAVARSLKAISPKFQNNQALFDNAIDLWAHEQLEAGTNALAEAILQLPENTVDGLPGIILAHCTQQLKIHHYEHPEYLLLILCVLDQWSWPQQFETVTTAARLSKPPKLESEYLPNP